LQKSEQRHHREEGASRRTAPRTTFTTVGSHQKLVHYVCEAQVIPYCATRKTSAMRNHLININGAAPHLYVYKQ